VHRFLGVVVEGNRVNLLPEITEFFKNALEEHRGELSVQLEVARPLGEELEKKIRSFLETEWKRRIKLNVNERPELIGGFVARAPGRTLDGSVQTQLQRLKQSVAG
jgi:F-type H+-transporting ATPase subunit delta